MSNIQIAAKAELFGAPIDAAFVSNKEQLSFDDKNYDTTVKTLLVYGKPDKPIHKSLTEVLTTLTFGKISQENLEEKLPDGVKNFLNGIKVAVNQVYFKSTKLGFDNNVTKKVKEDIEKQYGEMNNEYALWIDVAVDPEVMAGFPVTVTTLSFKIWSTNNSKVLEEMKITDIQKLLAGAGVVADTSVKDESTDSGKIPNRRTSKTEPTKQEDVKEDE